MRILALLIPAIFISACSQPSEEKRLVQSFWEAIQAKDAEALGHLIVNPSNSDLLSGNSGLTFELMGDSFKVLKVNDDNTVDVQFSRYCYPDTVLPTVLTKTDQGLRVDFAETFRKAAQNPQELQPTKKYCYELEDKPLSGVINGQSWAVNHADSTEISFGSRSIKRIALYSEACPNGNCFSVKTPSIILDALDLTGEGGNLNNKHSITIFTPPNSNIRISEGSYKVSDLSNGKTKLELAFEKEGGNRVNGYVTIDAKILLSRKTQGSKTQRSKKTQGSNLDTTVLTQ